MLHAIEVCEAKATGKKPAARTAEPAKVKSDQTHKQRFEQLLDDVVLGVPPKR